jgi:glycerophosphoryl diester phosphodiesterase
LRRRHSKPCARDSGRALVFVALILAHRGGAALAPENTLAGFANAIALGADGAELDVHVTRDGRVVVHHDYRLHPDLCRDESGDWLSLPTPRLRDLTYEEVSHYDVGRPRPDSHYAREHPELAPVDGERIPLLDEVVALVRKARKPFWLFVELKASVFDPSLSSPPKTLAEAVVAVLKSNDYIDRSAIIGFDWRSLIRAKALEPSLECWFSTYPQSWFQNGAPPPDHEPPPGPALALLREWQRAGKAPWAAGFDPVRYGSIVAALDAAGADGWFAHFSDATESPIRKAHARGLKVGAWTVDNPVLMRSLAERGVDAICTDRPDLASGWL